MFIKPAARGIRVLPRVKSNIYKDKMASPNNAFYVLEQAHSGLSNAVVYQKVGVTDSPVFEALTVSQSAVFNEDGLDKDFRIEGLSEENLFFIDASTDRFGFGTNNPDEFGHISKAVDGEFVGLLIENSQANEAGSTNETTEMRFGFGGNNDVARISITKKGDYNTNANEDSAMRLWIDINGTITRILNILNSGLSLDRPASKFDFNGDAGGGGQGIRYKDTGDSLRNALAFPGSDIVVLSNQAANGIVEIRANTSTAGSGGEVTVMTFEDDKAILNKEMDAGANTIGFTQQTATGDGTTTMDWKLGNKFKFTFGAQNETFTFTAPTKPANILLVLVQDSTGSRTVTWPVTVKWVGGTAPTLSTGANAIDIVSFYFDGTDYFGVDSLNFS